MILLMTAMVAERSAEGAEPSASRKPGDAVGGVAYRRAAMASTDLASPQVRSPHGDAPIVSPGGDGRRVTVARLYGPVTTWSLGAAALAAIGQTLGTVVAGRVAAAPSATLVGLLALCVVGGA